MTQKLIPSVSSSRVKFCLETVSGFALSSSVDDIAPASLMPSILLDMFKTRMLSVEGYHFDLLSLWINVYGLMISNNLSTLLSEY